MYFQECRLYEIWGTRRFRRKGQETVWNLQTLFVIGDTTISDSNRIKIFKNFKKTRENNESQGEKVEEVEGAEEPKDELINMIKNLSTITSLKLIHQLMRIY